MRSQCRRPDFRDLLEHAHVRCSSGAVLPFECLAGLPRTLRRGGCRSRRPYKCRRMASSYVHVLQWTLKPQAAGNPCSFKTSIIKLGLLGPPPGAIQQPAA